MFVFLGDARIYRSVDLGNVAELNRFGSGALISGNPFCEEKMVSLFLCKRFTLSHTLDKAQV